MRPKARGTRVCPEFGKRECCGARVSPRLLWEGAFVTSFDLGRRLPSRVTRGNPCPPNLERKLDSDLGT